MTRVTAITVVDEIMTTTLEFDPHARYDGESYQDILDRDSREAPECLRAENAPYLGSDSIPATHYTSQARFELEAEHMCASLADGVPNRRDSQCG